MLNRRQVGSLLVGACTGAWAQSASAEAPRLTPLFSISRSKNKNVVHYVARSRGAILDRERPIHAYWQMLAEDGRREELSWAERKLAYGFAVSKLSERGCSLRLVAFEQRPLMVQLGAHGFHARVAIAGQEAVLLRIFVKTSEAGLVPSVEYLEVIGTGPGGMPLRERINAR
jgi:hypothetical protein